MKDDFELRIREAKNKRERLLSERADKVARLKAAREKLSKLEEKARKNGFTPEELPDLILELEEELERKLVEFETSLSEVESQLSKYDD